MTISNPVQSLNETRKVPIICPICKSKKDLELPSSIVNQASNIATISLPKGLVCDHHFQMFVDRNFNVRGYQKVDLEIEINQKEQIQDDKDLFENLLLDGNYIEYRSKNHHQSIQSVLPRDRKISVRKAMSNEEIYEEFWEFIADDNAEFHEFIIKDKRRKKKEKV